MDSVATRTSATITASSISLNRIQMSGGVFAIEDWHRQGSIDASLTVTGDVRDMHPPIRDEVYRIGYEAIRNAYTHARESQVDIALGYGRDLTLRIADDGAGMDPTIVDRGKEGHFGLQDMRERASRIGATLSITSALKTGTTVVVAVPGRPAFRKESNGIVSRIRSKFSSAG